LTYVQSNHLFGKEIPRLNGEGMQDYDFFRVTNSSWESALAVARAESPTAWDFRWDPTALLLGPIMNKDFTRPFDNRMLCTEYLNFLYNDKFKNPLNGATLPSDIYNYQQSILRPVDYNLSFPKKSVLDDLIPSFNWRGQEKW